MNIFYNLQGWSYVHWVGAFFQIFQFSFQAVISNKRNKVETSELNHQFS